MLKRFLSTLLCLLALAGPAAATVVWIGGAETGDTSECVVKSSGNVSASTAHVHSGAYAFRIQGATSGSGYCESRGALGSGVTTLYVRVYFYIAAIPSTDNVVLETDSLIDVSLVQLFLKSTGVLGAKYQNGAYFASGSTVLVTGQWYLLQVKMVASATVGGMSVSLDGVSEFSAFVTNTGTGNLDRVDFGPYKNQASGTQADFYYDDFLIDTASMPGAGKVIARQGTSGTPTYTSWTKNSCTSSLIENCWSTTPFGTAASASSASANAAQTMMIASFGATQTGHGSETIGDHDTVNACMVGVVAKGSSSATGLQLRHRFSATDADTAIYPATLVTTDVFEQDNALWTPTIAQINAMEAGAVKANDAITDTLEDLWVMCDYTAATVAIVHKVRSE